MKYCIFICLIVCAASCSFSTNNTTTIIINSKSESAIASVRISSFGIDEVFKNLKFNQPQEKIVPIKKTKEVSDAAFIIKIYNNGTVLKSHSFGYYSGTADIDDSYEVEILNDYSIRQIQK